MGGGWCDLDHGLLPTVTHVPGRTDPPAHTSRASARAAPAPPARVTQSSRLGALPAHGERGDGPDIPNPGFLRSRNDGYAEVTRRCTPKAHLQHLRPNERHSRNCSAESGTPSLSSAHLQPALGGRNDG